MSEIFTMTSHRLVLLARVRKKKGLEMHIIDTEDQEIGKEVVSEKTQQIGK